MDIDLCQLGKDLKDNVKQKDTKLKLNSLSSNFSIKSGSSNRSGKMDDD